MTDEQKFALQLQQLAVMGFSNHAANLEGRLLLHTHTHTHPFNGPLSGTTRVSQYQKGKTNLDFTEARDSEWQWHQLGHMQVCISLQTDTTPAPHRSVFYRPDCCYIPMLKKALITVLLESKLFITDYR